jgi:multimeric flavodoxin WrbA
MGENKLITNNYFTGGYMKVVAFNGSARKDGNTAILVKSVFKELEAQGIDTELVQLAGKKLNGCIACYKCAENLDRKCAIDNDFANECIAKMDEADGIIIASPSYFADLTTSTKALIERAGIVTRVNGNMLARKVGAPICAQRRAGGTHVLSSINFFFFIGQMIVPGSSYWNIGMGKAPGEVESDTEGMNTMSDLGTNMAWLLQKLNA